MIRKSFFIFSLLMVTAVLCRAQAFITTSDLFRRPDAPGKLEISQDRAVDTLISRYILANKKLRTAEGTQGMMGIRIQIYYSSVRNAREESAKARQKFIDKFPDIVSYAEYQEPGWFMVRVGDYRTRTECYGDLIRIRKEFPDAYPVGPVVINFPDLTKK